MIDLGARAIFLAVLGYACLFSFTWPHGFAPLVSLASLPILLVGFFVILLGGYLFTGLLFAPFTWLKSEDFLRTILYAPPYETLPREFRDKPIRVPVSALIGDLRKAGLSWLDVALAFLPIVGLLIFCWGAWFLLSASLLERRWLITLIPILGFGYFSLAHLVDAKSVRSAILPLCGIGVVFVFIPALGLSGRPDAATFSPNPLVGLALQMVGAGGGIAIELDPIAPKASTVSLKGSLLFYDGVHAWYRPCDQPDGTVVIARVQSLRIFKPPIRSDVGSMLKLDESLCSR